MDLTCFRRDYTILVSFEDANRMQTFWLVHKTGNFGGAEQANSDSERACILWDSLSLDGRHAIVLGYSNGGYTLASTTVMTCNRCRSAT